MLTDPLLSLGTLGTCICVLRWCATWAACLLQRPFRLWLHRRSQAFHGDLQILKDFYELLVELATDVDLVNWHPAATGNAEMTDLEWAVKLIPLLKPVVQTLTKLRGARGSQFLSIMQEVLDTLSCPSDYSSAIVELRATILEVLVRLAQGMEGFPKGLAVGITSVMPLVNGGHFGNIYRVAGSEWCLKEPRRGREMPSFIREVLLIRHLQHPYILPAYGVAHVSWSSNPCLMMAWMTNGAVLAYLSTHRHDADRLLLQIAQALECMHAHGVVHADLRGANILVDDEGNAQVADFGFATFADAAVPWTRGCYAANARWTAPELLRPEIFGRDAEDYRPTRATDVYSFGCLCWELYTLRKPFGGRDGSAVMQVVQNRRPERPANMPNVVWVLVERCWSEKPTARPTVVEVVSILSKMIKHAPSAE